MVRIFFAKLFSYVTIHTMLASCFERYVIKIVITWLVDGLLNNLTMGCILLSKLIIKMFHIDLYYEISITLNYNEQ